MGNGIGKLGICFADGGAAGASRRNDISVVLSGEPLDEGLGHSFCYIRPDDCGGGGGGGGCAAAAAVETTTFRSISGASVSANASTPLSTSLLDNLCSYSSLDRASAFESSTSFASIPLQPVPRSCNASGQLCRLSGGFPSNSGPIERGFLSGPIERAFLSEPIDRGVYSGPMEFRGFDHHLQRSLSNGEFNGLRPKSRKRALVKFFRKAFSSIKRFGHKKELITHNSSNSNDCNAATTVTNSANYLSARVSLNNEVEEYDGDESLGSQNLQWAQGKAGEDRVHIVISEEHEWVFVGIYDGFNGPDAPDFLLSNLYSAVHKELKGLLWNDKFESFTSSESNSSSSSSNSSSNVEASEPVSVSVSLPGEEACEQSCQMEESRNNARNNARKNCGRVGVGKKWEESQRKWRGQWDKERLELDRRLKEEQHLNHLGSAANHSDVLKALSQALRNTEEAFLEIADKMVEENPELALMGSCALVMLMKGEDVYLLNVGDSRAVLGRKSEPDLWLGKAKAHRDLERINEETQHDLESNEVDEFDKITTLASLQLTMDHSTDVEEEVQRILNEHPDDASAILNDRVKGSLKVTRAFGAGFLKQPKWNNALLERFRIDYVGNTPYLTCSPSLYHHRLGPKDRFLILSSDGLYQYFTNEEAVSEVELFIASFPEGDPAQHLIEEVLFRAAKKAGMDFHELLEIPQGDRRRYHDDVSVIIISLEGRIWRSSV